MILKISKKKRKIFYKQFKENIKKKQLPSNLLTAMVHLLHKKKGKKDINYPTIN